MSVPVKEYLFVSATVFVGGLIGCAIRDRKVYTKQEDILAVSAVALTWPVSLPLGLGASAYAFVTGESIEISFIFSTGTDSKD